MVVARGRTAARLPEGGSIRIPGTTTVGDVVVTLRTRYSAEGFESPVPRDLWVEVCGETSHTLPEVMTAYWALANGLVPFFATVTNAPIDDLEIELAFDGTDGVQEHEFFQHFVRDEVGLPTHGRGIPAEHASKAFDAINSSPDADRLRRACTFYRTALGYLKPGQEIFCVVFLWMAVEALTKVAVRRGCQDADCTEGGLLVAWGLVKAADDEEKVKKAKGYLDGEARRRLIFHDDAGCQRTTREASDGFEHGYLDFDSIGALAIEAIRQGALEHVHRAILELSGLDEGSVSYLTSDKYRKPRANWPYTKVVKGTFIGPTEQLAAADQQYPMLKWVARIKQCVKRDNGIYDITPDDTLTIGCGEGVTFRAESFQVWGPENDPTQGAPSAALEAEE